MGMQDNTVMGMTSNNTRTDQIESVVQIIAEQCDRIKFSKYQVSRRTRSSCKRTVDGFLYQNKDISASTLLEILSIVGLQIVPKASTL